MSRKFTRRHRLAAILAAGSICFSSTILTANEPPPGTAPAEMVAAPEARPVATPVVAGPVKAAPCDNDNCQPGGGTSGSGASGGGRGGLVHGIGHQRVSPPTQWGYGQPDLFYNYHVGPMNGGMGALLYTSPGPVPPHVGQTYITYQPFMPHEQLYPHHRVYHRYYDDGRGLSRAHVSWYNPPVRHVAQGIHYKIKLAR